MKKFPENAVFAASGARSSAQNPITAVYEKLVLVVVIDRESGVVLDAEINAVCDLTNAFIQDLFEGRSLYTEAEEIIADIRDRYLGRSSKALTFCVRDILLRLRERGCIDADVIR